MWVTYLVMLDNIGEPQSYWGLFVIRDNIFLCHYLLISSLAWSDFEKIVL